MSECTVRGRVFKTPAMRPIYPETRGKRFKLFIILFGKIKWELTEDYYFPLDDGKVGVIRSGTITDGASFPPWIGGAFYGAAMLFISNPLFLIPVMYLLSRLMTGAFNPIGWALIAGLPHDEVFAKHSIELEDGSTYLEGCSLWQADDMFRRLYQNRWDTALMAFITWAGLRLAAPLAWFNLGPWANHRKNIDLSKKPPIV